MLWILAAVAALLALLCLTRVGVRIRMEETVRVDLTLGFWKIPMAPSETAEGPPKKPKKEKKKKEPKDRAGAAKKLQKPTLEDLKSARRALWPPVKRALERTRRGVRIAPLTLAVTVPGADDPAGAATQYGCVSAAVWTVMPPLEQLLEIKNPSIHIGLDFDRDQWLIRGEAGLSVRIGTLIALGFGVAIPALRWFLQYQKAHRPAARQPETTKAEASEPPAPAAA